MFVVKEIEPCRRAIVDARKDGHRVGLVPTMGALHEGHLSLIRAARQRCGFIAVTIFVNPMQFGPAEDLESYPRTLQTDLDVCRTERVDLVFTPAPETMYPPDHSTTVHVAGLTDGLCGPFRPGHFDGVATVVAKLFNILPADEAFFGEKDYQQLLVIRRMVRDLNIPIKIVACPTVREPDGLALSSRNAYLTGEQRRHAASLGRAMSTVVERARRGEQNVAKLQQFVRDEILRAGPADIEYVDIVDAETLSPLETIDRPARICLAVRIGACRLIDNMPIDVPAVKT